MTQQSMAGPPQGIDPDYVAKLESDNKNLLNEVMELSQAAEEAATLQDQLEQAEARIEELEAQAEATEALEGPAQLQSLNPGLPRSCASVWWTDRYASNVKPRGSSSNSVCLRA